MQKKSFVQIDMTKVNHKKLKSQITEPFVL